MGQMLPSDYKTIEYWIEVAGTLTKLEAQVTSRLKDGWTCVGGVGYAPSMYMQAMQRWTL